MSQADEPVVMISHTVTERYLADAWKEVICQLFGLSDDVVWFSSDPGAMGASRPFAEAIEHSIHSARAVISIQSPVSRFRPWILLEAGMALALRKSLYVIIYEQANVAGEDSIFGRLGTPLDAFQQFRGTDLKDVRESVIRLLQKDVGRSINLKRLDEAISAYQQSVEPWEYRWVAETKVLENRIQLTFETAERQLLANEGTIAKTVWVQGDRNSMLMFDLKVKRKTWGEFMTHLEKLNTPWPDSAARWARGLGSALQHALNGQCLEGPEGLPLYFDARRRCSYRPSISVQEDIGGKTSFYISFTFVPPELTIRPHTRVGILLDYLDFCRMIRWGVLEDPENPAFAAFLRDPEVLWERTGFASILRNPIPVRVREPEELIRGFLEKLFSVRTEFFNRGLEMNSIQDAIGNRDQAKLKDMLHTYHAAIAKIDPDNTGILPNPLPDINVLRQVYSDLLKASKGLYQLVHSALGPKLKNLAGSIEETDLHQKRCRIRTHGDAHQMASRTSG